MLKLETKKIVEESRIKGEQLASTHERVKELEAAIRQWASECGECGGDGKRVPLDAFGNVDSANAISCDQCEDIRALLPADITPTHNGEVKS